MNIIKKMLIRRLNKFFVNSRHIQTRTSLSLISKNIIISNKSKLRFTKNNTTMISSQIRSNRRKILHHRIQRITKLLNSNRSTNLTLFPNSPTRGGFYIIFCTAQVINYNLGIKPINKQIAICIINRWRMRSLTADQTIYFKTNCIIE